MSDTPEPPKVFANRLIRQLVDHMFGPDTSLVHADYMTLRTAFRSMGGEWAQVSLGSPAHLEKIKQVVTAWGQDPKRQNKSQQVI